MGPFYEFDSVRLTAPLDTPDGCIPAGTTGVLHEWFSDHAASLVEFGAPWRSVETVPAASLEADPGDARVVDGEP